MKTLIVKRGVVSLIMAGALMLLFSAVYPFFHPPHDVEALQVGSETFPFSTSSTTNQFSSLGVYPTHLIIPTISVDASVEKVGISTRNTIMIPTQYRNVAWYKYSAKPGEKGTAVFVGHLDIAGGFPGVFIHLDDLSVGDDIYVTGTSLPESATTTTFHYKVTETKAIPYEDVGTLEKALAQKNDSHILLITCYGTWMSEDKTYNERYIVRGELAR